MTTRSASGCPTIIEQVVLAPGDLGKLVHGFLHDGGCGGVVWIDRLAPLEVDIRVLGGAAQHGSVGGQPAGAMLADQVIVDQRTQVIVQELNDFGHFMRGAEAVEKVQERDARFQRCSLCDGGKILRFLHAAG